ncbi:transcriptional regulator, TetR family [Parafrankia sp. EUN1f]|nr:transcriptional regulator, TetR family [Parafrankia sp. EUN1f]
MAGGTAKRPYRTSPHVEQARADRREAAARAVESAALNLFELHGFDAVTAGDIATAAGISIRTFYRYFPTKDDLLRAGVRRRAQAIATALAARAADEPPMRSIRWAVHDVVAAEDTTDVARWIRISMVSPAASNVMLGINVLELNAVLGDFLSTRLGTARDSLQPTMLAVAAAAVMIAAHARWSFHGGDLATMLSDALAVLDAIPPNASDI